jgi:hypothetical protein
MAGQDCPSFAGTPIFQSFFEEHDAYERFHIHFVGVRPKNHTTSTGTSTTSGGIEDRQNMLGGTAIFDTVPDPYVLVETIGPDTGSNTDYFPIGVHKFPVLTNSSMPVWDAKCTLIAKKGSCSTTGIKIQMLDYNPAASMRHDELLAEIVLERCELPDAKDINSDDDGWQEYVKTADTTGRMKDLEILFSIKVTDCASRVVSKEETEALYHQDTADANNIRTYLEKPLVDPSGKPEDNALLQCWRRPSSKKAVLWVLVRSIREQRIH